MVKTGDTLKDVITYINIRKEHLYLEKKRVPQVVPKLKRQKAIDKLASKIEELHNISKVLNEDIKEHSKKEWHRVDKLKKL